MAARTPQRRKQRSPGRTAAAGTAAAPLSADAEPHANGPASTALRASLGRAALVFDCDGRVLTAWPTEARSQGGASAPWIGQSLPALLPKRQADDCLAQIRRALATGETVGVEYRWQEDGAEARVSAALSPLSPSQVMWVGSDAARPPPVDPLAAAQEPVLRLVATRAPLSTILSRLAELVEDRIEGGRCSILLMDSGHRLRSAAAPSLPENLVRSIDGLAVESHGDGFAAAAARQEWVVVPDMARSPPWAGYATLAKGHGLRACWTAPILSASSRALGVIALFLPGRRTPTSPEVEAIDAAAHLASIAVDRAQVEVDEIGRVAELEVVRQATLSLTASLELPAVLDSILESTLRLARGSSDSHIFLYDSENGGRLTFGASLWADGRKNVRLYEPRPNGLTHTVARLGEMVLVPDVATHSLYEGVPHDDLGAIIGLPLQIGRRVVGVMTIAYAQPQAFAESDLHALRLLADQAAIAVENARLFDAERAARAQAEALREVAYTTNISFDREVLLRLALDQLARVVAFDSAAVMLLQSGELKLVAERGFRSSSQHYSPAQIAPLQHIQQVIQQGVPVIIPDTTLDSRWNPLPGSEYIRCWLGVPLLVKNQVIGVLNLDKEQPGFYQQQDAGLALAFANQFAVAIENARLFEASQRQAQELAGLYGTVLAIGSALETHVLLSRLHEQVRQIMAPDAFAVVLFHPGSDELEIALAIESDEVLTDLIGKRVPVEDGGLTGWVVRSRQPLSIGDIEVDPLPAEPRHLTRPARAWMAVPLIAHDHMIGVVSVQSFRPQAFSPADGRFLESLAMQLAIALENARLYEVARRSAAEFKATSDILRILNATTDLDDTIPVIAAGLKGLAGCDQISLVLLDDGQESFQHTSLEEPLADLARVAPSPVQVTAAAKSLLAGRHHLTPDLAAEVDSPHERHLYDLGYRSRLNLPLVAGDRILGALGFMWSQPAGYSRVNVPLLSQLTDAIALALEKDSLFNQVRARAAELGRLYAAAQDMAASLEPRIVLEQLVRHLTEALNGTSGCIMEVRLADATLTVLAEYWSQAATPAERRSSLGRTSSMRERPAIGRSILEQSILSLQADSPELTEAERGRLRDHGVKSIVLIPIVARGQVLGEVEIWESRQERAFTATERRLAQALVQHAGTVIENTRLFDETRRRDATLEALAYVGEQLLIAGDLEAVLPHVLARLGRAADVSRAYIYGNHAAEDGTLFSSPQYVWAAPEWTAGAGSADLGTIGLSDDFRRWAQALRAGYPIYGLVTELPPAERARLLGRGVQSVAVVPIFSGGAWWGFLGFDDCEQQRSWSAAELEALRSAASTLGAAIARQRSETAEREQRTLSDALRDTASALNSTLHFDEVLDRILANIGRVVPHDAADIMLVDQASGELRVARSRGYAERGLEEWLLGLRFAVGELATFRYMLETGQPLSLPDVQAYSSWVELPEAAWIRSYAGAPIRIKTETIGFLNLASAVPGFFSPAHAERLRAFADQAAVAIENARLYDSIRQNHLELAALYHASSQLIHPRGDVQALAVQIAEAVTKEFASAHCELLVMDEAGTELQSLAQAGRLPVSDPPAIPLGGASLIAAAARAGEAIYAPDVRAEPDYLLGNPLTRSELALPLRVGGKVIGVLNLESPEVDAFDVRARRVIGAFAEHAALALENARLLTRLDLARQVAEEASELKTQFLANTSHELRTPLTGIIGSLSMVLDDLCYTREEERQCVGLAFAASQRLLRIINDVLDIAKIESGRMEVELEPVDLAPLFTEVYLILRLQADEKKLRLEFHPPADRRRRLWADGDKVRQILLNIVGNAIKFTEEGSVTVSAEKLANRMLITVRDTGIGIPPDKQSRLFQPFVQVDGSMTRKYGGTGLGLSISRKLAEMMGGALALHSGGIGQGCTCRLALPLESGPAEREPAA